MTDIVEIFTDGACRGNPGPGGWAAMLRCGEWKRELSGAEPDTTNNRMELMAAIGALEALKRRCRVRLTTDSEYVQKGVSRWMHDWKKRNWKTSGRQPVKNLDLWQRLDRLNAEHEVEWCWVKGHSGHPENDRVDELANVAIDRLLSSEDPAAD